MRQSAAGHQQELHNGTVESVFKAIDDAVGMKGRLADSQVRATTAGRDTLAEVSWASRSTGGQPRAGGQVRHNESSAKAYVPP